MPFRRSGFRFISFATRSNFPSISTCSLSALQITASLSRRPHPFPVPILCTSDGKIQLKRGSASTSTGVGIKPSRDRRPTQSRSASDSTEVGVRSRLNPTPIPTGLISTSLVSDFDLGESRCRDSLSRDFSSFLPTVRARTIFSFPRYAGRKRKLASEGLYAFLPAQRAGTRENPTQAGIGINLNRDRHQTQSGSASDPVGIECRLNRGRRPIPVESDADPDWVHFDIARIRFRSCPVALPIPPSHDADPGQSRYCDSLSRDFPPA